MAQHIIDSDDTAYVMRRIRELYLKDSTVTIVLMGKCTWARRYVDWEIQASLRHGQTVTANGLLGIKLRSYPKRGSQFPNRLNLNLKQPENQEDCYARWIEYPARSDTLPTKLMLRSPDGQHTRSGLITLAIISGITVVADEQTHRLPSDSDVK